MTTAPPTPEQAAAFIMPEGPWVGRTLFQIDLANGRIYLRHIAGTWCRHDVQRIREHVLIYLRAFPTRPRVKRELATSDLEPFQS